MAKEWLGVKRAVSEPFCALCLSSAEMSKTFDVILKMTGEKAYERLSWSWRFRFISGQKLNFSLTHQRTASDLIITHPWICMYIQGLLRNEKESLIPNDCHCGEINCTGYDPTILVSIRK